MAKKKKSIDLNDREIFFEIEQERYKAVRFYPSNMTVDITRYIDGKKAGQKNIAFAHLPKNIKQIIKPK